MEQDRSSFAIETNLANKTLAARIPRWRAAGYQIVLAFIRLPSADIAVQRVAHRVRSGGHNIPETTIRRRYRVGLRLFREVYQPMADVWRVYDNSGAGRAILAAPGRIRRWSTWESILQETSHE